MEPGTFETYARAFTYAIYTKRVLDYPHWTSSSPSQRTLVFNTHAIATL